MKSGAISWVIGLVLVGGAVAVAVNRAQQTPEDQQAKLDYNQRKTQIANQKDAVVDKTAATKDKLEAEAKARRENIRQEANQELQSVTAKAEQAEERAEDQARAEQQKLDQRLDQAKVELRADQQAADQRIQGAQGALAGQQSADSEQLSGTITAVSPGARTLSIREGLASSPTQPFRSPTQLSVDEKAAVTHAGQRLSLADLQVGDQVMIQVQEDAGRRTVMNIIINQRAASPVAR